MSFHSTFSISQTRALLVCVMNGPLLPHASSSSPTHAVERNGDALIRKWERAELPLAFVESSLSPQSEENCPRFAAVSSDRDVCVSREEPAYLINPRIRPRPGDLVFHSDLPSLLRHRQFTRLFEDLGGPLLILMGDNLEGMILETAIDGFVSRHPIVIVTDAAPLGSTKKADLPLRSQAVPLLSCFARVMQTEELLNEWAIA